MEVSKVEEEIITRQFHHKWLFDLCLAMREVMDNFHIQYEECSIDVGNPPTFTFFDENCSTKQVFMWLRVIQSWATYDG